ncbi:MAG: winged helix-turn-helix domain-containing protein [Magnetococcales bacterium]|nr:winged helix-turn-helix domain-containing protein [Magnetococcales bacterium]
MIPVGFKSALAPIAYAQTRRPKLDNKRLGYGETTLPQFDCPGFYLSSPLEFQNRLQSRSKFGRIEDEFGQRVCRETIRKALRRSSFSWKKAKKLLGKADPKKRAEFLESLKPLLTNAIGCYSNF